MVSPGLAGRAAIRQRYHRREPVEVLTARRRPVRARGRTQNHALAGEHGKPLAVMETPGIAWLITFSQPGCQRGGNRQSEQDPSAEPISGHAPRQQILEHS